MKSPSSIKKLTAGAMLFAMATVTAQAVLEFHVAPGGNKANPGTKDQPFASIKQARDAVRDLVAKGLEDDVLVSVHGGTYYLAKPVVFGPEDGGTADHSVTWAAHQDERVILSGGRPLRSKWKRSPSGMWITEIPEVKAGKWFFRQLYGNNERLPRGRFPDEGFLKIAEVSKDSKTLRVTPEIPGTNLGGQDTELVVLQNWSISREFVAASTTDTLTAKTPIGWVGHGQCRPKKGMSVFLEHSLAFVTKPGQWHLDRRLGLLSYLARDGEDPNQMSFVAPVLEQLVLIKGSRDAPVRNLSFRGLTFAHTAFGMPAIGYGGIQACYHGTTQKEALTFAVPVAIELINAHGCRLSDCRLSHLGGSGLGLGAGCRDNTITGCEIGDVGGTGVNIGHMRTKNPLWADWSDPRDVPSNNEVANCFIHHCGAELWGAHGIFDAMTSGSRIRHNEVAWLPYGGIATGYVWNTERTSQENCLIEFNHVHEVMHQLNDSGCLYTLGFQPGSVVRGNLFHGVRIGGFAGGQVCNNGIFMDEGSKGFHFEDNVIYDISQRPGARNTPVRFNRSKHEWQTWKNNTIQHAPEPPAAAKALADKAGLEPKFRKLLKTNQASKP